MGRFRLPIAAGVLGAMLTAWPGIATGTTSPWTVVPSPNPGELASYLEAVVPLSSTSAWAVGAWYREATSTPGTLTEYWNGSAWRVVPSPNATDGYNELFGVDALSSGNVWAVGYSNIANFGSERTLILRWTGRSWRIVPSPNLGSNANILYDVELIGPGDAWAVGFGNATSLYDERPVIEHWNGRRWSLVQGPPMGADSAKLSGVSGTGPNDVWAVGTRNGHTLVEHWDGTAWRIVPSPDGARQSSRLEAVAALAPDDVWAVGTTEGVSQSDVLVEHWDGTAWRVIPAPDGALDQSILTDVVALSPSSVVAVGTTFDPLLVNNRTLTEAFDGTSWVRVPSPNPSAEYNLTNGVGGLAGGTLWAVGNADEATLTLRASSPG